MITLEYEKRDQDENPIYNDGDRYKAVDTFRRTIYDLDGCKVGFRFSAAPTTPPVPPIRPKRDEYPDKKPHSYWQAKRQEWIRKGDVMSRNLFHYTSLVALVAFALVGTQAQAGTATATVAATIQSPVTLTSSANLGFGSIFSDVGACNIGVSAAGVRTVLTGNCALGSATGVSVSNWLAHGTPGASFTMTNPTSTTLTSGANTMVLDTFVDSSVPSILDGLNGNASWQTGATLHLLANQASGVYSGSISETANY